jgi:hypothetical protein
MKEDATEEAYEAGFNMPFIKEFNSDYGYVRVEWTQET